VGGTVLTPRKIQHHHVGTLLHAFKYNLTAIRGDVEIANVEAGSEVRQPPSDAGLQVNEPEILGGAGTNVGGAGCASCVGAAMEVFDAMADTSLFVTPAFFRAMRPSTDVSYAPGERLMAVTIMSS
jgi:hypothetical protein